MRKRDLPLAHQFVQALERFDTLKRSLPGIHRPENKDALVYQLVDSVRRVRYVQAISKEAHHPQRADPTSNLFDPLRAAVLKQRAGEEDEAFWLVFLAVHFGKSGSTGWRLLQDVYGGLGTGPAWTWALTSTYPAAFRTWLARSNATLRGSDGVRRRFGNHRKYESLDAHSPSGTGTVVESYVSWVVPHGGHRALIEDAAAVAGGDPKKMFAALYRSMSAVARFGRTAKFDYLSMLGNLGFAPITPNSAFLAGATGPLRGARLLLGGSTQAPLSEPELERVLLELGDELEVSMQVIEDALCNWQKSPGDYVRFRG